MFVMLAESEANFEKFYIVAALCPNGCFDDAAPRLVDWNPTEGQGRERRPTMCYAFSTSDLSAGAAISGDSKQPALIAPHVLL